MEQNQQTSRWVSDVQSVTDSVTGLIDSIFGNRPRNPRDPISGPEEIICPGGQVLVAGVCQCPSGQEFKDGRCQKTGTPTLLWIGLGVAAIAGTYFLVTKFKNK